MEFYIKLNQEPFYKKSKGKKIELNGYTFYIPFKNQNEPFDFYFNGKGINSDPIGDKNLKGLKARIEKVGKEKFEQVAKCNNQSINEHIKEMKGQEKQPEA